MSILAKPFRLEDEKRPDLAKEYILEYGKENDFRSLERFVEDRQDKDFSLIFTDVIDIDKVKELLKKNPNVCIRIEKQEDLLAVPMIVSNDIPFYFGPKLPAYNYQSLSYLAHLGVSQIFIVDDLCYDMKTVRKVCDDFGIKIRLILNRVPLVASPHTDAPNAPFYFPEDRHLLDEYYDIYEFDCFDDEHHWQDSQFKVLYGAWFEKESWPGSLHEINKDVDREIYYEAYLPAFHSDMRLTCGATCCQDRPCRMCFQLDDIAQGLRTKGIYVKQP